MTEGTAEDWQAIAAANMAFAAHLPDRVLEHLRLLDGDFGGFAVDRLTHSLQTATRAYRADRDDEYVLCALLHDIGDTLGSFNHADIAAAIVKPFVSEQNHWMVDKHADVPGLLLLPPPRARPRRARAVPRSRVLRLHGRVLPGLRPALVRRVVRHAPAGALRAAGARADGRAQAQHLRGVELTEASPLAVAFADRVSRLAGSDAVRFVEKASSAELVVLGVSTAGSLSPYNPRRDVDIAALRQQWDVLGDIVHTLARAGEPFGWDGPLDVEAQTWIDLHPHWPFEPDRLPRHFERFPRSLTKPRSAMWTSTAMPDLASVWLTDAPYDWSTPADGTPVWRLRIRPRPRVFEITTVDDWVTLCEAFGEDSTEFYRSHLEPHALRWAPPFITPDWNTVRSAFDAVHLTFAGFLAAHDEVVPVGKGTTVLAGWGSECTLWLNWVFDGADRIEWSP